MNISLKGEDVYLNSASCYYIIDALYLNTIKEEINSINVDFIEAEIKEKIFPYLNAPFAIVNFLQSNTELEVIGVHRIKKVSDEQLNSYCFATDTGLVIFCEKSMFAAFVQAFSYYDLIDVMNGPINTSYWQAVVSPFGSYNCALILSPGINKGFDFDGSGLYEFR